MPIYEYVCSSCSHEWSDLVPKHDSPFPDCPECEGKEVEQVLKNL
ncbi:MAG: zinc ribbon domain-containing protein [Candidatus Lindowbacteria bacterium]|nr:zinc ribbon domain-containing protein [Candidatus Lindowbacteria bacterium]